MAHRLSADPRSDPLSDLRFSLEIMPGSRKYVFNASARAEILTKLHASLMGSNNNQKYFLPKGVGSVPQHQLLSDYQASVGFGGAGKDDGEDGSGRTEGRPCSHIFKKGETCYRCKDCALDDSCVMCARCFHSSEHTGHTISFFISTQSGGCCDCGDEEAWRHNTHCQYHPYTSSPTPSPVPPGPLSNDLPSVSPNIDNLPQSLKDSMHRTIAFAIDFVLDVLDYSPDETSIPTNETDLRLQPTADPMMKDVFCLVLWNDDKHSFDEVKTVILELSGRGSGPDREKEVDALVRRLEEEGRVMVDMNVVNTNPPPPIPSSLPHHGGQQQQPSAKLLEMARSMAQIDMGVTIRRAYDTFCEQAVAVIIEWLLDISRARVGSDSLILREILAKELLMPRRRDAFGFGLAGLSNKGSAGTILPLSAATINEVPNPTRLDYMFVYHGKLWKRLRLSLKEVYASVISLSRTHKLTVAGHYASMYHRIVDTYLLLDRETESSIKYFSLQLFTVPSVATHLVKNHRIIIRLLNLLVNFFTNTHRPPEKRTIQQPPAISPFYPPGPGVAVGAVGGTGAGGVGGGGGVGGAGGGGTTPISPTSHNLHSYPSSQHVHSIYHSTNTAPSQPSGGAAGAGSGVAGVVGPGVPGSGGGGAASTYIPINQQLQHLQAHPTMEVESIPFKSKRFMPIFSDLRYLMQTRPVQRLLAEGSGVGWVGGQAQITGHLSYILPITQTCQLFMFIQPNRRAATVHVEYETDAWISVFNVTLSLSRVVRVLGQAYANAPTLGAANANDMDAQPPLPPPPPGTVLKRGTKEIVEALEVVVTCLLGVCRTNGGEVPYQKDPPLLLAALHAQVGQAYSPTFYFNPILLTLDKTKFAPINFHRVSFGMGSSHGGKGKKRSRVYEVVKFDVADGWVSFHHSLYWLLAELYKSTHLLSDEQFESEFGGTQFGVYKSLRDVVVRCAGGEKGVLAIIDFPLRVLVMVAQIRVGLWVRNGFAIRGQLMHYRDYMLRELCFDQDLFNLQTALVLLDPDVVLVTMLDRFNLTTYFNGLADEDEDEVLHDADDDDDGASTSTRTTPYKTSYGEVSQLCGMVEELLFVLITILSENASASRMPIPAAVRREIVHALAMGPCGFTELTKRVAERFGENAAFEKILSDVAVFKPPEGSNDVGQYELKEEVLFEEVNPFFFHYTRNRREEVENALRTKLKKKLAKEGKPDKEWVYIPKPFGVVEGIYKDIPKVFESEVLLQIMFYTVFNVLVLTEGSQGAENGGTQQTATTPPSGEAILDQALHLIMLALVEREEYVSIMAATRKFEEDRNLVDVICALEYHEQYKGYRARVQWILQKMSPYISDEVAARRREYEALRPSVDPEEARKKAAKARQEAIMQQMKAQQASFAINFDDLDDEDDEGMSVDEGNTDEAEANVSFGTCIVCQEELLATGKVFGALGLVQPSRFIRKHPDSQHHTYLNEVLGMVNSLDRASVKKEPFPPLDADTRDAKAANSSSVFEGFPANYTRFGLVSSVCTHMMHLECFQVYSVSIRQRHRAQPTRNHPESIPRKEYICPLCKSLGNVILPVVNPSSTKLNATPFPDWIRAAGINILKSKPDPHLESLQIRNGTGEFVFWACQDPGYSSAVRSNNTEGKPELLEAAKMLDTVMVVSKSFSQQTRHLRDRPEPEVGERGAGLYLPEELLGYTVAQIETALRGIEAPKGGVVADNLTEAQTKMIRGVTSVLTRLAALQFKGRPEEGRDAVRQAIVKRLLPEWSRTSLTSFHSPLLLRDPFTILVEAAAVAPDILRHVLILTYYASLARGVIGLVYILNKTRSYSITQIQRRAHEDIFGDVRMFFMSVVRHSPLFEHTATLAFETFGEARIEKLLYAFTLPFLRRAALLCRAVLPNAFPTPTSAPGTCEYSRLLTMLGIPPLSDLPNQDTLQNALSGWCAHYGHTHNMSQLNCGVMLDYPGVYRLARLPLALDTLFTFPEKFLTCERCNTVSNDPGVCLICGTVVCVQSSCCVDEDYNNRGECNMHTRECSGMVGLFFCIKKSVVLWLNAGNGSFYPSPYLDAHGEPDLQMKRGRRQFLHNARFEEVRKLWLNHGIPTIVARKLESTLDAGGWETM